MSMRTGLPFLVDGEYCTSLEEVDDPADRDWHMFETEDVHPFGHKSFVVWSQFSEIDVKERKRMIDVAVTVIDWLFTEKYWHYVFASLYQGNEEVFRWELV